MILNTTYKNDEFAKRINALVGPPFSFLQALRLKGVGSKRMIIEETCANFQDYLNVVSDVTYANIELRPKGILVLINKGLKNFTWAIPYYQLAWFKTNGVSIHAQGRFIHFRNSKTLRENKRFFYKLLNEKIKYDQQHNLLDYV